VLHDPFATSQRAAPTRADAAGVTPDEPAGQPAQVRQTLCCGVLPVCCFARKTTPVWICGRTMHTFSDAAGVTPDEPAGQPAQVRRPCVVGCCVAVFCGSSASSSVSKHG
jgi:hypothetical protein